MLIKDQVATAPCTDPIQVRFLLLRQSYLFLSGLAPQALCLRLLRRLRGKLARLCVGPPVSFARTHPSKNVVEFSPALALQGDAGLRSSFDNAARRHG